MNSAFRTAAPPAAPEAPPKAPPEAPPAPESPPAAASTHTEQCPLSVWQEAAGVTLLGGQDQVQLKQRHTYRCSRVIT